MNTLPGYSLLENICPLHPGFLINIPEDVNYSNIDCTYVHPNPLPNQSVQSL